MKRIAIILITLCYLLPAIGLSINVHWCGGKISSVKFQSITAPECRCGKKMLPGCCKDFQTLIKLTDNQKAGSSFSFPKDFQTEIQQFTTASKTGLLYFELQTFDYFKDKVPPFKNKLPVYLVNKVFRI